MFGININEINTVNTNIVTLDPVKLFEEKNLEISPEFNFEEAVEMLQKEKGFFSKETYLNFLQKSLGTHWDEIHKQEKDQMWIVYVYVWYHLMIVNNKKREERSKCLEVLAEAEKRLEKIAQKRRSR